MFEQRQVWWACMCVGVISISITTTYAASLPQHNANRKLELPSDYCKGKINGTYEHPNTCHAMVKCNKENVYLFGCVSCPYDRLKCPNGWYVFDQLKGVCVSADQTTKVCHEYNVLASTEWDWDTTTYTPETTTGWDTTTYEPETTTGWDWDTTTYETETATWSETTTYEPETTTGWDWDTTTTGWDTTTYTPETTTGWDTTTYEPETTTGWDTTTHEPETTTGWDTTTYEPETTTGWDWDTTTYTPETTTGWDTTTYEPETTTGWDWDTTTYTPETTTWWDTTTYEPETTTGWDTTTYEPETTTGWDTTTYEPETTTGWDTTTYEPETSTGSDWDTTTYTPETTTEWDTTTYEPETTTGWDTTWTWTDETTTSIYTTSKPPTTPPVVGDPCEENCSHWGICTKYRSCKNGRIIERDCGPNALWRPGGPDGGQCDDIRNIPSNIINEYRNSTECLKCYWKQTGYCKRQYKYQADGLDYPNEQILSCSPGFGFDTNAQTCLRCNQTDNGYGGKCVSCT